MANSSEIFQKVRDAVDIVDVIGEHVALKRAGREFKGLCPFHEDHRPSMAVVPHKQIFHCFVCGTGGDVFKFVELYHKMSKGETLRLLAQRAGIQLPDLPNHRATTEGPSQREQISNINEWACSYFEKYLRSPLGKAGLDYFHGRGLTDEIIGRFRLGMSPDSWTGLVNAAIRLGSKIEQLDLAGLVKKRSDGSPYDVFRNRVIFPIIDSTGGSSSSGRVIAFGGRILVEKRDENGDILDAKYLNSPETRLFNKSESIYGLNLARQQIVRTRTAIVVEGYMDVIGCHQAGVTNVIATLGTALTPEHARLLKNYAQTIVLVFDSDDAGRRATDRAMEVFVRSPIDVKIAAVPDGKDPFDFCMKNGGEAFQKLVDAAPDALTFQWNRLQSQIAGIDSVAGRQEAISQFIRFAAASMGTGGGIHKIDPIRRGQLIVQLSKIVGLPADEVTALLYEASYKESPRTKKQETVNETTARIRREQQVRPGKNAAVDAERWALGGLLNEPSLYLKVRDDLDVRLFKKYQFVAQVVFEYFEDREATVCNLADFLDYIQSVEKPNTDSELVVFCAILWERMVGDWLEPSNLSAETQKLYKYWRDQLGHTLEMVIDDCLDFLRLVSGPTDDPGASNEAGPSEIKEVNELHKSIMSAKARNDDRRGNRRSVGIESSVRRQSVDPRTRIKKLEEVAEAVEV